ncbi:MAG TPA: hypothetical protein VK325_07280 [Pseudoxanthomonas sp.]|nr:hypothetical protein [Pseudoxanthomonas sp.]
MNAPLPPVNDVPQRRKRAARTAWVIAALAVAIYAGFILSGVLGQ